MRHVGSSRTGCCTTFRQRRRICESRRTAAIVNLPLIGVSADRVDHDGTVAISVALSDGEHLTRLIHDVARIYVEQPDDGSTAALIVESADGTTTTVHLRATPLRGRPSVLDPQAASGTPPRNRSAT
jgi:hypothetical protein